MFGVSRFGRSNLIMLRWKWRLTPVVLAAVEATDNVGRWSRANSFSRMIRFYKEHYFARIF